MVDEVRDLVLELAQVYQSYGFKQMTGNVKENEP